LMANRISEYASAADGRSEGVQIYASQGEGTFLPMVHGLGPRPGQRIVYVDGGFDLFSSGHIAFLSLVTSLEAASGRHRDWYTDSARQKRLTEFGEDYGPAYIVAGVHDDEVINHHKGLNYPIMNIFERGLCVVQCRYVHQVVFGAPYAPNEAFLASLPALSASKEANIDLPNAVYHGPTSYMPSSATPDPHADAKAAGVFVETPEHDFQDVNAAQIVQRILDRRMEYEERQRKKGIKSTGEGALRRAEMEREADAKGRDGA
ncbi:choline phosphate cytidylyltransferase, partial [Teratosphaeriaceae sp. CCFEE 6253]